MLVSLKSLADTLQTNHVPAAFASVTDRIETSQAWHKFTIAILPVFACLHYIVQRSSKLLFQTLPQPAEPRLHFSSDPARRRVIQHDF